MLIVMVRGGPDTRAGVVVMISNGDGGVVLLVVVELLCTKLSVTVLESGVAPWSVAPSHVPPSYKASPGPPSPRRHTH